MRWLPSGGFVCLWGCIPTSVCWICWETTKSTPNDKSSMGRLDISKTMPDGSARAWQHSASAPASNDTSNTLIPSDLGNAQMDTILFTEYLGEETWSWSETISHEVGGVWHCGGRGAPRARVGWRGQGSVQELSHWQSDWKRSSGDLS